MKLKLLILLLFPLIAAAQEVKPVLSNSYLALINADSLQLKKNRPADSSNNINRSLLHFSGDVFNGNFWVKDILIKKNSIKLQPVSDNGLYIGGSISSVTEIRRSNQQPAIQQQFVQGRSINGTLSWQGPHTNELFSYGPAINTLEYDGTNYPYDVNGQLVAAGTGNGKKLTGYSPSIFRTAAMFSNALTLQAKYRKNFQQIFSIAIKAGQSNEHSFIIRNKNNAEHFSTVFEAIVKKYTITGSYNYRQEIFSNNNRNGFLNRVYQNALLSPVSFDNKQGNVITAAQQKSYSLYADNPFFLLENNGHRFLQQQYTGNLSVERNIRHGKIKVSQSFEKQQQQSNEGYQPGTAFFENGMALNRNTRDANYFLNTYAEYNIPYNNYSLRSAVTANYIYNNNHSGINYLPNYSAYNYQRSSHDASIGIASSYRENNLDAGLNLSNKLYASNTLTRNNFFLPGVAGYIRVNNLFDASGLSVNLKSSITRFTSELPISRSLAQNNLLQYAAGNALQYLPVNEVMSYNKLQAIKHKEFTSGLEINYNYRLTLYFDHFTRYAFNDVFPVINAGKLQLVNMADRRNRGAEAGLSWYLPLYGKSRLILQNSFVFSSYKSKVTDVRSGYDYTPIAGFSDVHKAIVKDAPFGAIVGNSFLRDANNNIIIGADGFPLVNNTPSVIGDPAPDFTIKLNHGISLKNWSLNIDWEWRKGGDIWNGTEALLDHYGRSAGSADLRNITNYVFKGVDVNGKPNTIPVNFYDPSLPVTQNRWVRYGPTGVAESYIQKGDCIRLNHIGISYKPKIKKYLQQLNLSLYATNIILWSAYKGADPNQLLNDQPGTSGLDFFNIPSYHSFGFSVSLKF